MIASLVGAVTGVALAAACGFRVFAPLFAMGLAARGGVLRLSADFAWAASDPALCCLGAATAAEIAAYFVPWVDNALDSIAAPAAVVAGVLVTAACAVDMPAWLKWTLALIAGGGAAGAMQLATSVTRAASTALTGGLGNPAFGALESGAAVALAALAIFLPLLALGACAALLVLASRRLSRRLRASAAA